MSIQLVKRVPSLKLFTRMCAEVHHRGNKQMPYVRETRRYKIGVRIAQFKGENKKRVLKWGQKKGIKKGPTNGALKWGQQTDH